MLNPDAGYTIERIKTDLKDLRRLPGHQRIQENTSALILLCRKLEQLSSGLITTQTRIDNLQREIEK